jgi:hypothetical protein
VLRCSGGEFGVRGSRETCSNENSSAEFILLIVMFKTTMCDTDSSFEGVESDCDVEVRKKERNRVLISE